MILRGIDRDLTNREIAREMGVNGWIVRNDLMAMKYNRDPELKQAYLDQETRALANRRSITNGRDEIFHLMTGMTFQERNFENMVDFYKPELVKILESENEYIAIMDLAKNVQRVLVHNEIITGRKCRRQISLKARGYLPKSRHIKSALMVV
jgi:hypothetical protein